jgi:predicted DNA binding CopG/RHH family protein
MKSKKTNPMEVKTVRVPADLWRDVKQMAKQEGISESEFIRLALKATVRDILTIAADITKGRKT